MFYPINLKYLLFTLNHHFHTDALKLSFLKVLKITKKKKKEKKEKSLYKIGFQFEKNTDLKLSITSKFPNKEM